MEEDENSCIDWKQCLICQKDHTSKVVKPTNQGFLSFIAVLRKWNCYGLIPPLMTKHQFDELLNSTEQKLSDNAAFWHKLCRNKCDEQKLKRKSDLISGSNDETKTCLKDTDSEDLVSREVNLPSSRSMRSQVNAKKNKHCCFFCDNEHGEMRISATLELDEKVRRYANILGDEKILIKLAEGDMTAIDAQYHIHCLVLFYNRVRKMTLKPHPKTSEDFDKESLALAKVVDYIECKCREDLTSVEVFKLSDLKKMYEEYMSESALTGNIEFSSKMHSTRFKEKILQAVPCLTAYNQGRDVFLISEAEMGHVVSKVYEKSEDGDAYAMIKCCKTVRNYVLDHETDEFDGNFSENSQIDSVPDALVSLVSLLLYGPKYKGTVTQEVLTISQLIKANTKKRSFTTGHHHAKETPLTLYTGLLFHSEFRSKQMIQTFHRLGMSVSYDRILTIEKDLIRAKCTQYHKDGVVCPSQLKLGLPTLFTIDNIDINPKSNTSKGSFHGTILSVFQTPRVSNMGTTRSKISISNDNVIDDLPDSYSIVPAQLGNLRSECPHNTTYKLPSTDILSNVSGSHREWVDITIDKIKSNKNEDCLTWKSFYKKKQNSLDELRPGISSILPLFHEKAASAAMVKHAMDVFLSIVKFCNPCQVPIIATDLPIYAIGKELQWKYPTQYGEDKLVWVLGGLHCEMAAWSMVGRLLSDSGWTGIIAEADITSEGSSEALLLASHLMKTRHAHIVTLLALEILQNDAMVEEGVSPENREEWITERTKVNPTFTFWQIVKNLEIMILSAVRGIRERNHHLYINCMEYVCYYFFSLDSTNYKRWMPVNIKDLRTLPESVENLFIQGEWVFSKTSEPFSFIPLDHANEHNVKVMKSSEGIVGLQQNRNLLQNWVIASPELVRILDEFNAGIKTKKSGKTDSAAANNRLVSEVKQMVLTISKYGNPFLLETNQLMTIDYHDCVDSPEIFNIKSIHEMGKKQYDDYVSNVLVKGTVSIHETIKMNNVYIFKKRKSSHSASKNKVKEVKSDFLLISKLLMAGQTRDIDQAALFSHENNSYPPSLSENGELNLPSSKSDFLSKFKEMNVLREHLPKKVDVHIFDGPGIMYFLKNKVTCHNTFGELKRNVFLPWLISQLTHSDRIDFIWDRYPQDSLKSYTRNERGRSNRRHVGEEIRIPKKMEDFLKNGENKEDLFRFLSDGVETVDIPDSKIILITNGESVTIKGQQFQDIGLCDHEESDTRIMAHLKHAVNHECRSVFLSTVDSDVVAIATYVFSTIVEDFPNLQFYILFGFGEHSSIFDVRKIYEYLGKDMCRALPFFITFTGCDTTSQFKRKGKVSAWNSWLAYPEATNGFLIEPFETIDKHSERFKIIERFVCVMYSRTTDCSSVNELRESLFPKMEFSNLPPTQDALLQHVKRAVFQASIWLKSTNWKINAPDPCNFGWKREQEKYSPLWMILPPISKECNALLKCGCKSVPFCTKNCKCKRLWMLPCTHLCYCKGQCNTSL